MTPWASSSAQSKRIMIGSAIFARHIGDREVSLYFTMGNPFPQIVPSNHGDSGPHLTRDFFGPFEPTAQTASLSVQQMTASIKRP